MAQTGKGKVHARAYALEGGAEPEPNDVVESDICIDNETGKALFDPGATHSFIYVEFANKLFLTAEILPYTFEVSSPMGMTTTTDLIHRNCNVNFEGQIYPANLIELPIQRYDVILGMDWLYLNHAQMDCYAKKVKLGKISHINPKQISKNPQNHSIYDLGYRS